LRFERRVQIGKRALSVSHQGIDRAALQKVVVLAGCQARKLFILQNARKMGARKVFVSMVEMGSFG
jgi:hypothetical protein